MAYGHALAVVILRIDANPGDQSLHEVPPIGEGKRLIETHFEVVEQAGRRVQLRLCGLDPAFLAAQFGKLRYE